MKKYNKRETVALIVDYIGLITLLLGPFILATILGSTVYFLGYLVSWIPGGLIFGIAGFILEKGEEKMICFKDMTFCKESTCKEFGPCIRTFDEEAQKAADKWWGDLEGSAPVCFYASAPKCYKKREDD